MGLRKVEHDDGTSLLPWFEHVTPGYSQNGIETDTFPGAEMHIVQGEQGERMHVWTGPIPNAVRKVARIAPKDPQTSLLPLVDIGYWEE